MNNREQSNTDNRPPKTVRATRFESVNSNQMNSRRAI